MLSLGLAVIFGLLNIINFTHGAQYMMGAFCAYFLLQHAGVGYWWSLLLAPLVVGATGMVIERTMLVAALQARPPVRAAADLRPRADHPGRCSATTTARRACRTAMPEELAGGINLGFMFLPKYRAWVIVASLVDLPRRPGS